MPDEYAEWRVTPPQIFDQRSSNIRTLCINKEEKQRKKRCVNPQKSMPQLIQMVFSKSTVSQLNMCGHALI